MAKAKKTIEWGSMEWFLKDEEKATKGEFCSRHTKAYKKVREAVNDAAGTVAGKGTNLKLKSVVKMTSSLEGCEDPNWYVALITGGLNGPGSWLDYMTCIRRLVDAMDFIANDVWLVDLKNDCADDVWDMRIGFRV